MYEIFNPQDFSEQTEQSDASVNNNNDTDARQPSEGEMHDKVTAEIEATALPVDAVLSDAPDDKSVELASQTTTFDEAEEATLPVADASGGGSDTPPRLPYETGGNGDNDGDGSEGNDEEPVERVPGREATARLEVHETISPTDITKGVIDTTALNEILIEHLGPQLTEEAVVVGSAAAKAALGDGFRDPHDLDVAVSEDGLRELHRRGWEVATTASGKLLARKEGLDVGVGWEGSPREELEARTWQTGDGVRIANLADVTDYKDARGTNKDKADLAAIRERLLDPERAPLSAAVAAHEAEVVRSCLPEHLRDDPALQTGVELAASGLLIARTVYGDPETGGVQQIVGSLEQPEHGTRAFYHNAGGLPDDMKHLVTHFDTVNAADAAAGRPRTFSDQDYVTGVSAEAYADAVYGHGREKDNLHDPQQADEHRSARLYAAHAVALGRAPEDAAAGKAMIDGTAFEEGTGKQAGKSSSDPRVQALSGVDLQSLSERSAAQDALALSLEDNMSTRWSPQRVLGRAVAAEGVTLRSAEEGFDFVQENQAFRPTDIPNAPRLGDVVLNRLDGNISFMRDGYQYPQSWTQENSQQRQDGADLLAGIVEDVDSGAITWRQGYERAKRYAEGEA
ncbi:MAG TPA: hypothetical protein VLF60_04895 [Candidatus Saccharimonadales bacterium]|nr:hypothetical protein [Candidatus Saccharimonadales bacterium]